MPNSSTTQFTVHPDERNRPHAFPQPAIRHRQRGFSLIEVALSLAILAFAFLSLLALLPLGMMNNQVSIEQTHAVGDISMLEADLRYTDPILNEGLSAVYDLELPYALDDDGNLVINPAIEAGKLYTKGLDDDGKPVDLNAGDRTRYQVSVVYLNDRSTIYPGEPITARLTVNWPSVVTTDGNELIQADKVTGYVEGFVTFPSP